MARRMVARAREHKQSFSLPCFEAQAREAEQHALLIRQVVMGSLSLPAAPPPRDQKGPKEPSK